MGFTFGIMFVIGFVGGWFVKGLADKTVVEIARAERDVMANELEELKAVGAALESSFKDSPEAA